MRQGDEEDDGFHLGDAVRRYFFPPRVVNVNGGHTRINRIEEVVIDEDEAANNDEAANIELQEAANIELQEAVNIELQEEDDDDDEDDDDGPPCSANCFFWFFVGLGCTLLLSFLGSIIFVIYRNSRDSLEHNNRRDIADL